MPHLALTLGLYQLLLQDSHIPTAAILHQRPNFCDSLYHAIICVQCGPVALCSVLSLVILFQTTTMSGQHSLLKFKVNPYRPHIQSYPITLMNSSILMLSQHQKIKFHVFRMPVIFIWYQKQGQKPLYFQTPGQLPQIQAPEQHHRLQKLFQNQVFCSNLVVSVFPRILCC